MLKFGNTIWAAQLAARPKSSVPFYEKLSTYVSPRVSAVNKAEKDGSGVLKKVYIYYVLKLYPLQMYFICKYMEIDYLHIKDRQSIDQKHNEE